MAKPYVTIDVSFAELLNKRQIQIGVENTKRKQQQLNANAATKKLLICETLTLDDAGLVLNELSGHQLKWSKRLVLVIAAICALGLCSSVLITQRLITALYSYVLLMDQTLHMGFAVSCLFWTIVIIAKLLLQTTTFYEERGLVMKLCETTQLNIGEKHIKVVQIATDGVHKYTLIPKQLLDVCGLHLKDVQYNSVLPSNNSCMLRKITKHFQVILCVLCAIIAVLPLGFIFQWFVIRPIADYYLQFYMLLAHFLITIALANFFWLMFFKRAIALRKLCLSLRSSLLIIEAKPKQTQMYAVDHVYKENVLN